MKTTLPTAEQLKLDWSNNARWNGITRAYSAEDVVRLRGTVAVEHSLARTRRGKTVALAAHGGLRRRARRPDRQPGDAAGQGRAQGDLPLRLAGRGRRQRRRRDVSGPVAVPGQFGAAGGQAHQQYAAARGPAQPRRRQTDEHRFPAADRRRRRSRFRRRAQCLRTDEGDDRGRRRRRAFRGPAGRASRSAGTWAARCWCPRARRSRSSSPRAWPPTSWACRR